MIRGRHVRVSRRGERRPITPGLLVAAFALTLVGPTAAGAQSASRTGDAAAPADVLGCYDVAVGFWRAVTDEPVTGPALPPDRSADSANFAIPPRVRLSGDALPPPREGWFQAAAPEGALPVRHPIQRWRPTEDGIDLGYSTGFAGVHGSLTAREGGWSGTLRTGSDVVGLQRYERPVTLARVDCASPPPVSVDVLRGLPRTVELEGGARLTLGEIPPPGLRTVPRSSGAEGVAATTVGLFAGSDSVAYRVGWGDERVGVIQLLFPAPADAAPLIARITEEFGPPDPNTGVPGGWWHSRVTELSVITYPNGGYRVLLQDPRVPGR